jgi:predicted small secreted protein
MFKRPILISTVVLSLAVVGCETVGGGDDIEVKSFSINGSSTELEDDRVTIDSSISSGKFELEWKVDDDDASGYNAYFYVSINSELSDSDINFYNLYCSEYDDCDHDDDNDEDCWFDNNLSLVCEDNDNDEVEIDDLIDTLPQDLYIIIEACNDVECDTEVVPVRFR